jgi:acetyltransferase-like isoleucine patch superfamily enzyme
VGPRTTIAAGARLTAGSVVGDDVAVPPGAVLCGDRIPEGAA